MIISNEEAEFFNKVSKQKGEQTFVVIERGKPDKVYETVSELLDNTGVQEHEIFNMLLMYGFHFGKSGNRLITFNKDKYIERAKDFMQNGFSGNG